jgi:hypothetical protein
MLLRKYSFYLSGLILSQLAVQAPNVLANPASEKIVEKSESQDEVPSEEFWMYMAEFAEDEELIDPDVLISDSHLRAESVKVKSETKSSTAKNLRDSEESL